jgi:N-acetylmuramoyl-L-alanine amidase
MLRVIVTLIVALMPGLANAQPRIVIDPGHGGTDPGGVGSGMQEKHVVLDVSQRFKRLLDADTADESGGGKWTSLMTRTSDVFVSLAARSAYSNNQNADRFVSIHANAFSDPAANGIETFSLASTGTAANLRNLVQAEMVAAWGLTNRGNKTANFAVLRDTAAPAVLHELGFITNATDAAKLGSATEREKAAVAHLRALQRHYNLAPYVPSGPPQDQDGDITGRVVDSDGPIVGARVAISGGVSVLTDGNGGFTLADLPVGPHTLTASADGYKNAVHEVTVAAGVREDIEIVLSRAADDTTLDGDATGGCSTHKSVRLWLLAAFAVVLRRRRCVARVGSR